LQVANEELRRVRKELARGGKAPLRFVIAGDPTKPLFSFTVPRRLLITLGAALALCALAGPLVGGGRPARALDALSTAIVELKQDPPRNPDEPLPERMYSEHTLMPRLQADAVPEGEHFTIEVANTHKVVKLNLTGPAGEPDRESYRALRHELRCLRTGAESPIDPRLIELLHQIALESGRDRSSGVSSSRSSSRRQLPHKGMAADIRVAGLTMAELRDLARSVLAASATIHRPVRARRRTRDALLLDHTSGHPITVAIPTTRHSCPIGTIPAPLAVAAAYPETVQVRAVASPPSTVFVPNTPSPENLLLLPKQGDAQPSPTAPLR
jgi:uncharacterized protein YcbK (DUF882 family)